MAEALKPGDVVQLKSGGPKMTVQSMEEVSGDQWVVCVWFQGTMKLKDRFMPEMVQPGV